MIDIYEKIRYFNLGVNFIYSYSIFTFFLTEVTKLLVMLKHCTLRELLNYAQKNTQVPPRR